MKLHPSLHFLWMCSCWFRASLTKPNAFLCIVSKHHLEVKSCIFYFCWKLCFLLIHSAKCFRDCEASAFCFSEDSESRFPLLATFSFRFTISDENAWKSSHKKTNHPIVQNITPVTFPLHPSSSSSSEVAPGTWRFNHSLSNITWVTLI